MDSEGLFGKIVVPFTVLYIDPHELHMISKTYRSMKIAIHYSATKDFWRKGLALAWGDDNCLSESDILRFQWPSIGKGWEQGLINFTRARILSSSSSQHTLDDGQLLTKVASLKGTQVVIMYGSNDKVVRIDGAVAEQMRKDYPNIKLVRMEGQGHDPFEEKVDEFVSVLEKML